MRPRPSLPLAGAAAAALVAAATLGPLVALGLAAGGLGRLGPADIAALRFTLWQAAVSAVLSVALALPVARALARRRFPGRGALVTLLGAPFLMPALVAVLALLSVFGRNGILNDGLRALGLPELQVYGPQGVILAHVFFNLPLAARLLLQGWQEIPAERFRLAAALGLGPGAVFRLIEWPMLRAVVPGALAAIFLICLTSFAVALTLGGGPRATTLEVAIYQAVRLDFDLARAALLALIQLGLCAAAVTAALALGRAAGFGAGLDRPVVRWDAGGAWLRLQDGVAIALAAAFLLAPLLMLALAGAPRLPGLPPEVWRAAARSALVALAAAALTLALALGLGLGALRRRWFELAGMLPLGLSALVLGTGLFLIVFPLVDPARLALPVTVLVNALAALPFALRALAPAIREVEAGQGRLADSLGIRGLARLRILLLPRLRRPLGLAGGLAAALSAGDLGVITLFAGTETATLPLALYRLMGAYRMADAAGAALLLLGLALGLFWLFDRGGRIGAQA